MIIVGLDFETANGKSGSICSAGIAVLENGKLLDKKEWLIRPHNTMSYFRPDFIDVHHITPESVRTAPEFAEIWTIMNPILCGADIVVMHNAPFDTKHLRGALQVYKLKADSFKYTCSLHHSRRAYPNLPDHRLCTMAAHIGHAFTHHDALDDAEAAALVLHALNLKEFEVQTFALSPA